MKTKILLLAGIVCQLSAMDYESYYEPNLTPIVGLREKIHNHIPSLLSCAALKLKRPTIEGTRSNTYIYEQLSKHIDHQNPQNLSLFSQEILDEAIALQDAPPLNSYAAQGHIQSPDQLWHYLIRQKDISFDFFMRYIRENIPENTKALKTLLAHLDPCFKLEPWFDQDTLLILHARFGNLERFKPIYEKIMQENKSLDYPKKYLPIVHESLQQAVDNDELEVVKFLVEHETFFNVLHLNTVAKTGHLVITYFLDNPQYKLHFSDFISVFNTAAQYKNIEACETLYKHGIRPSEYYLRSYIENAVQVADFQWANMLKKYRKGLPKE